MKILFKLVLLVLVLLLALLYCWKFASTGSGASEPEIIATAQAQLPVVEPIAKSAPKVWTPAVVEQAIESEVAKYDNVNLYVAKKIAQCESSYNVKAVGLAGEIGVYQFMFGTFDQYKKKYGWPELDIYEPADNIKLAIKMFEQGEYRHWTCWRKYFN